MPVRSDQEGGEEEGGGVPRESRAAQEDAQGQRRLVHSTMAYGPFELSMLKLEVNYTKRCTYVCISSNHVYIPYHITQWL